VDFQVVHVGPIGMDVGADGMSGTVNKIIAEAILFVASDKASFISGASIPVNGGKAAL